PPRRRTHMLPATNRLARTLTAAVLLAGAVAAAPAARADALKDLERTIKKEPAYKSKNPKYGLLVFGPGSRDRVWLGHDGGTLYVDRNGNGDLTEPDKKVVGKVNADGRDADAYCVFNVDELRVGDRVHKHMEVFASLLTRSHNSVENRANARAALAADPKARA